MTAEEILTAAARYLPQARVAYDEAGDEAGVVYFAHEALRWYAMDVAACTALVDEILRHLEPVGGLVRVHEHDLGVDALPLPSYSEWCADARHQPAGEGLTQAEALRAAGWYEAHKHPSHDDGPPKC